MRKKFEKCIQFDIDINNFFLSLVWSKIAQLLWCLHWFY